MVCASPLARPGLNGLTRCHWVSVAGFLGASVFHGTRHAQTIHVRHVPFVRGFVVTEHVF